MPKPKLVQPTDKLPLKLTPAQRKAIEESLVLDPTYAKIVGETPPGEPVMMTLDDLDDFCGWIAAEANHTENRKLQRTLDAVFEKIEALLERYDYEDAEPRAETGKTPAAAKPAKQSATKTSTGELFQFKITLRDSEPEIWRRIIVEDCTLDKMHELVQTAMGWTNSHLHQFEIQGKLYANPAVLEDYFDELECRDSTTTLLSDVVPKKAKRFAFNYEYDFGDGWEHEILFEGRPEVEKGKKYPLCLAGERACPPEDVGGVWGYMRLIVVLSDPKHEEYSEMREWFGGTLKPEKFDPKAATRDMKRGMPGTLEW